LLTGGGPVKLLLTIKAFGIARLFPGSPGKAARRVTFKPSRAINLTGGGEIATSKAS
jgi:hypothetical protein